MTHSSRPIPEKSARPDDELPTDSQWRRIPEPQPLIVDQAKPALNPRRIAIVASVILCAVSAIFVFLKASHTPPQPPAEKSTALPATAAPPPSSAPVFAAIPQDVPRPAPDPVKPAPAPVITEDTRKIDEVIRLYTTNPAQDHTVTAQVLINLLPTLSKQGQLEGARHIANLLPDSEYQRVMPIWRNARADRDVLEILGSDLVNRDPTIMLPAMLEALRQPAHPFQARGRRALQLFLDGDYGNDFAKWDEALQRFTQAQAAGTGFGGGE